ncbi:hypothetical protein [Chloroflexus aurantiacus]|nr:hypothetical protein [Chloroflexus aurantiacus]
MWHNELRDSLSNERRAWFAEIEEVFLVPGVGIHQSRWWWSIIE